MCVRNTCTEKTNTSQTLLIYSYLFPTDSAMSWLTEAVLLGCRDARLADLHLSEENATLLDLALGSSREPASSLWRKMKEYSVSRGED